ncbi:MAG: hypothetical protein R3B13_18085 [Polyangiaceae bacterium]
MLRQLQLRRLRAVVAHARRHVPFYQDAWQRAGVSERSLRSLDDLRRFPIPDRQAIESDPEAIVSREHLARYRAGSAFIRRSGGSSGGPQLEVHADPSSWRRLDAFYYRAFVALGYRPWKEVAYYWSAPFKKRLHERLGFMPKLRVPAEAGLREQLSILSAHPGLWWYYHPSALFALARKLPSQLRAAKPVRVISHAELLPGAMRRAIERVLGQPVYDQYGTSEFNRMAWQCLEHRDYHVDADSIILEVVDEANQPVRPGEVGRALVTGLMNRMMPLIRYELGDLLVPSDRTCDCGRRLPMISSIEGRVRDVFKLPGGGTRTPREVMEPFADIEGIDLFRVTQTTKSSARLELETEVADPAALTESCRRRFAPICPGLDLDVQIVDALNKQPTGKCTMVQSQVPLDGGKGPSFRS